MRKHLLFICTAFITAAAFAHGEPAVNITADLADFRAIMNNGKVDLKWKCMGTDIAVYTLERSRNNSNFEVVSTINAPLTGDITMDFAETDFSPYPGISYYRLRATAPDGSFSYSPVIPVNYLFAHDNSSVFPNPASSGEKLSLSFGGEETSDILVVVKNPDGQEFYSKVFLSTTEKQVAELAPGQDLPPGNYIITASSKNFLYSKKIIIR